MQKNSRTRNSFLNLITGFGGQFLLIVFKFIVRTVLIKTLGTAYLGINGLFSDIMTMLSLTELGFDTAINFKLYKPLAENDDKRVRILLSFYKTAYRVIGAAITIIGLCLIPLLPVLIKDYDTLAELNINAVLIFMLYLLQASSSYFFFAYRSAVIKAAQKEYILNISSYIVTIVTNIFQILALIIFKNFVIYTALLAISTIIQNLVYAVVSQHYYPQFFIKENDRISKEEGRSILKDCGALFVYRINSVIMKATDNMVLSSFIGLTIVALYSNYLLFFTAIKSILFRFYNAVKASMGNLFTAADYKIREDFFRVMNFMTMTLFGIAAVGISVVANELISTWIGEEYVIPQPFPILIGFEILFAGLKENLGQMRNVTGIFRQMWYRPIIGIVINLVTSVVLVNFIGIYGVLIGTIAADIFSNFLIDPFVIYKYSLNNPKNSKDYYIQNGQYFLVLMIGYGVCCLLCRYFMFGFGWLSVVVHGMICMIIIPLFFYVFFRKSKECQYLISVAKRILHRRLDKD